jgi:hypothetical protein
LDEAAQRQNRRILDERQEWDGRSA